MLDKPARYIKARVFVPGRYLEPGLVLVGKIRPGANPKGIAKVKEASTLHKNMSLGSKDFQGHKG
jgi:hypothetical protein